MVAARHQVQQPAVATQLILSRVHSTCGCATKSRVGGRRCRWSGRKVQGLSDSTRAASRLSSIAYGYASGSCSVCLRRLVSLRACSAVRASGLWRCPALPRLGEAWIWKV